MKKNELNKPFFVLPLRTALYIITFFSLLLVTLFFLSISAYLLITIHDLHSYSSIIFFIFFFLMGCFVLVDGWITRLRHFLVKTQITEYGIICTRLGKRIKEISWNEVIQVQSIHLIDHTVKMEAPLILVSGHEITEEEQMKAREQIGKKKVLFVLPFEKKILKTIPKYLRPKRVPTITRQIRFWPPEW